MREATAAERADTRAYYLPHHAVIREDKTTTKVRVVFDASCKTTNGKSLNDQLHLGPTIQDDLFSLLIKWRKGEIAYTGDIEKMYRQVWVDERDTKYLRLLWRNSPNEQIKEYLLRTVTFGTASAPFQAIRALHEVGNQIESEKPKIAAAIKEQFYVDDFLGTADTVQEAAHEQK